VRRLALALTLAAVLVAAPRLVLIFLEADSLQPGAEVRTALLGASGAALALVLTGGGAYLVHAIVRVGRFQRLLFALWLVILTCIAVLVTPRLVAGLQGASTPLAQVLATPALRWGWSATAVLAAELVATGCMIAYAAEHQQHHLLAELQQELEQLAHQRNRLQQQLLQANQRLEEQEQEQHLQQHRREQRHLQEEQQHREEQRDREQRCERRRRLSLWPCSALLGGHVQWQQAKNLQQPAIRRARLPVLTEEDRAPQRTNFFRDEIIQ